MTVEEYVEGLKELLPAHFIEAIKDCSVSDQKLLWLYLSFLLHLKI